MGSRFIICDGAELARLWARIGASDASEREQLTWVPREGEQRARPPGFRALQGGVTAPGLQRLNPKEGDEFALITDDGPFVRAAVSALHEVAPDAPLLVMSDKLGDDALPAHRCLRHTGLRTQIRDDVDSEFRHLGNLRRVVRLQEAFARHERIGIMLQPDPDPDGIAAGLALRAVLGRRAATAPLISFGEITRPENQAMVDALGVNVLLVTKDGLDEFDALALVDVQPNVFGENASARAMGVAAVIDHHPERGGYGAALKDIRSGYGATASILIEYLQAAGVELTPKLATALLYGIKSDTRLLGRDTSAADMQAFAIAHSFHSPALLRRIERPALPRDGLHALGRALAKTRVDEGIHLLVLGRVREDVLAQVAELGLQAEGAEWAIAAGNVGGNLVFSVRNTGVGRAAGEVVRAVVARYDASGGGHRSMAKGIVPLKSIRARHGNAARATIHRALFDAFVRAINEPRE